MSLALLLYPILISAEENATEDEELDTCSDSDDFSRYILADPLEIMPNINESTIVYFNYQCDHETNIELLNGSDVIVDTILSNRTFFSGDNQFIWDGIINSQYAPDGIYSLKVVPNDDDSIYAFSTQVEVYNFKYPALLDIYGEEFKSNLRNYRRGAQ